MRPVDFNESNTIFGPPADLDESQCMKIPAFVGKTLGGSLDGAGMVVVAWRPSPEELLEIEKGNPIYITMMGGLAPHYLSTSFERATKPA